MVVEVALVLLSATAALALRPWRALGPSGPPWPWLAWAAVMPLLWTSDRLVQIPAAQPLSGACLLMLMTGWPLAVLTLVVVAAATAWLGGLGLDDTLHRLLWLGLVPATFGVLIGAMIRAWLPRHLMVYILGRGFLATALSGVLAGLIATQVEGPRLGLSLPEMMLGRGLAAWGDAMLSGMLVSIFVAFRPEWLSTYHDRIYLPR